MPSGQGSVQWERCYLESFS
ncbi:UNVERIFIED_CONTAM: hypothetical protein GTU68_035720 [Idotea baltica]|nr:hypothetical protein [Idotea baltica]